MSKQTKQPAEHKPNGVILTAKDVAILLKVSLSYAYIIMYRTGKSFHLGRSIRIYKEDLREYIQKKIDDENPGFQSLLDLINKNDEE